MPETLAVGKYEPLSRWVHQGYKILIDNQALTDPDKTSVRRIEAFGYPLLNLPELQSKDILAPVGRQDSRIVAVGYYENNRRTRDPNQLRGRRKEQILIHKHLQRYKLIKLFH